MSNESKAEFIDPDVVAWDAKISANTAIAVYKAAAADADNAKAAYKDAVYKAAAAKKTARAAYQNWKYAEKRC